MQTEIIKATTKRAAAHLQETQDTFLIVGQPILQGAKPVVYLQGNLDQIDALLDYTREQVELARAQQNA